MADDIMHALQKFWNSCVLVKHLVYSFEWQASNSALYCTICTVDYLVIKIMTKYYLLFGVVVYIKNNVFNVAVCF